MGYWKILIKNCRLFDGYKICGKKDILISGGVVEKIADSIDEKAQFTFDAAGRLVTPGLVDIHAHIYGISDPDIGTPGESSCFPFGVTAVCDGCAELNDENFLEGLKLNIGVFVPAWVKDKKPQLEATESLIKKYGDKVIGVKAYFDSIVSKETDIDCLKKICDFAHERELKVMVHCSHSPTDMKQIVKTLGKGDILTHIYHEGENNTCLYDDYAPLKLARDKGVILDAGFAGHAHTDFFVLEKAMRDGWFPDTVSTDVTNLSTFLRGGHYGMTLCMTLCRHFGMKEEDILRAVTTSAADAVGKPEWGRLKEGQPADIAILEYVEKPFDFTPFTEKGAVGKMGYNCCMTLSNGQIVWRDKNLF